MLRTLTSRVLHWLMVVLQLMCFVYVITMGHQECLNFQLNRPLSRSQSIHFNYTRMYLVCTCDVCVCVSY